MADKLQHNMKCQHNSEIRQQATPGADPELVPGGGAEAMSRAPPSPSHPSPPFPILPLPPSLPFPLPLLPSLPSPPVEEGSRGPPPENFEILDCCR